MFSLSIYLDNDEDGNSDIDLDIDATNNIQRQYKRKSYTYNRLVNSIDACLEDNNFELITLPEKLETIEGLLPDPANKKKKKKIVFQNRPRKQGGRQRACDVLPNRPGVISSAKSAKKPLEIVTLFFTDDMIKTIVDLTNVRIEVSLSRIDQEKFESSKYPHFKVTNSVELKAFLGLMYYRGLYGMHTYRLDYVFGNAIGPPMFGATMSRMRFQFLLAHLSFDDITTRPERWQCDRFTAIRDFFEECNKIFAKILIPEDYLLIDETLYPMRTQINFKQYNPNKPAKYGLLFKSINSARYPYTQQTHAYCGKPEGMPDLQYYVTGTIEYVKLLVTNFSKQQNLAGRNISMDRLYSSFELANWLFDRNITMIGTLMQSRAGIPPMIKDFTHREPLTSVTFWEKDGNTNLSSYVVKTSKRKKNVLMLATVEPILGTTKDDGKKKPALYKLYDFTKGGADIIDQKMNTYTVKPKSNKWTIVAFSYLLDTIRVNSQTVYALNN